MHFRSNASNSPLSERFPPWAVSAAIHAAMGLVIGGVLIPRPEKPLVEMVVIEKPVAAPADAKPLAITKPRSKPEAEKKAKQVYGVTRKSLQDEAGPEVKAGNTVAKAPDNEKLRLEDEESLPIPTDEFLVTSMPKILSEVRVAYPAEAKSKGVEGPVVMDLLIDEKGKVREATLVEGPGLGLNEAAVAAARGFRFEPAQVEEKAVAVRIRYTYRFVLE